MYRAARICEDGVNANHNVTCSLTLDYSRTAEGNRDGEYIFFRMNQADVALFLQVTRIIVLERKKDQKNLQSKLIITSRLLPETGRSQKQRTLKHETNKTDRNPPITNHKQ